MLQRPPWRALRDINLFDSPVTDLADLRGLKLKGLNIQNTKARSHPTRYGPTLPSSTSVVSTPVAMSILNTVPRSCAPPCCVVPINLKRKMGALLHPF